MTGRELDALIAEKVMGWKRMTEGEIHPGHRFDEVYPNAGKAGFDRTRMSEWWFDASERDAKGDAVEKYPAVDLDGYDYLPPRFAPSTDIAAAWLVVEKLKEMGRELHVTNSWPYNRGSRWMCEVCSGNETSSPPTVWHSAKADTAPVAICRAALAALEVTP